jgi:serine/threonine protein kinase
MWNSRAAEILSEICSPEQLRDEDPSESWDLWSIAVVTYEMLAGVHPFSGATPSDVRTAILSGKGKPFHTSVPEAPVSLQNFFENVLAPRFERRPKSALQFLTDFRHSIQ